MSTPFTLVDPTAADAPGLLRLHAAVAAEGDTLLFYPDEIDTSVEHEVARLNGPGIRVVARVRFSLIGSVDVHRETARRLQGVGHLGIFVDSAWRGQGVGRALMIAAMTRFADEGGRKLILQVHATNTRACALYTRLGFVDEGLLRDEIEVLPGQFVDVRRMAWFPMRLT